jgi:RNA polymerase sigma-70 factor (ECF subfamily)
MGRAVVSSQKVWPVSGVSPGPPAEETSVDPLACLVDRCRHGDRTAFARLVAETQVGVYNLAYRVLGHPDEAQDMTQEVYLRVWRALPDFRGDSRFGTWLYRVTVNACLNRRRSLRAQLRVVDDDDALAALPTEEDDPMAATMKKERNDSLWSAVDRLPEKYRLVVSLFYQQQLSYGEIAEMLSLPLGTVKAHLNRARQGLARMLRSMQEEVPDVYL